MIPKRILIAIGCLAFLLPVALILAHEGEHNHDDADLVLTASPWLTGSTNVKIYVSGSKRVIESNGIPDHSTGRFPNSGNPHRISEQTYRFEMPLNPVAGDQPTPMMMQPFGVALNGVPFDPGAAEFYKNDRHSGWQYEALGGAVSLGLDWNNAHVQPTGAYHYHGIPAELLKQEITQDKDMVLLGWAADGFPIYGPWGYRDPESAHSGLLQLKSSYRIKDGYRPSGESGPGGRYDGSFVQDFEYVEGLGDLDRCNGRFGVTPEFPEGTYYYVLTEDYPFIPRYFKGTPDPSFDRRAQRGNRPPPRGRDRRGIPPPPTNTFPGSSNLTE